MFQDLKFFYDEETKLMQSNDSAISVRCVFSRFPEVYFTLYWEDRTIHFMAMQEQIKDEASDVEKIKWELCDLNVTPNDPTQKAHIYKNRSEGLQAIDIMITFLRQCDGLDNIFLQSGQVEIISARLSERIRQGVIKGVD